eukprot:1646526-Pyramimonas_sp.AAC.1
MVAILPSRGAWVDARQTDGGGARCLAPKWQRKEPDSASAKRVLRQSLLGSALCRLGMAYSLAGQRSALEG